MVQINASADVFSSRSRQTISILFYHFLPSHVLPFPVYPFLHWQLYDPKVFEQPAFVWHSFIPTEHSSISGKLNCFNLAVKTNANFCGIVI